VDIVGKTKTDCSVKGSWEYLLLHGYGYCFHHIEVQFFVLKALGFAVTRHLSQPINLPITDAKYAAEEFNQAPLYNHEVLLHKKTHLVDVGYGPNSLFGELKISLDVPIQLGDTTYRIVTVTDNWLELQIDVKGQWIALYRFCEKEEMADEMVAAQNVEMFETKKVHLIRDGVLFLAQYRAEGELLERKFIRIDFLDTFSASLKVLQNGSPVRSEEIGSVAELETIVREEFNLECSNTMKNLFPQ
jgi:arylamine N-acetyltransferase